jgi:hypothetical protein
MNSKAICGIFHPDPAEYTFFSATHGTVSKIDDILGNKASLKKYKNIHNAFILITS